jgi:hypothetical protein
LSFQHWLHHLFNPHCEQCALVAQEKLELELTRAECKSCEMLRSELDRLNRRYDALLERVLTPPQAPIEEEKELTEFKPRGPMPWRERKKILEADDRKRAEIMRANKLEPVQPITEDDLEKELAEVKANA